MKWPELAAEFDRLIEGYRRAGAAKVGVGGVLVLP
jgi:hypothetical protein